MQAFKEFLSAFTQEQRQEIKRTFRKGALALAIAALGYGLVLGSEYIHPDTVSLGLVAVGLSLIAVGGFMAVRNLTPANL